MKKVRTEEEALAFFLKDHDKNCIAINSKGEEKECEIYPEALNHLKS